MKQARKYHLLSVAAVLMVASSVQAETIVKVSGVHLCCGACVRDINDAMKKVDGATALVDRGEETVTVKAKDDETAQKALDAMAGAGYHGTTDSKELVIKDDSNAPEGNVKRLELTGIHNCCGGCNRAIVKALESVDGVEANTAKAKSDSFVVEGDFNAKELIQALYKVGFHARVKK